QLFDDVDGNSDLAEDMGDVVALLGVPEVPLREGAWPVVDDAGGQVLGGEDEHGQRWAEGATRPQRLCELGADRLDDRRGRGLTPVPVLPLLVAAREPSLTASEPGLGQVPGEGKGESEVLVDAAAQAHDSGLGEH